MNALLLHLGATLRLHGRNRMALIYGYVFPLIFLVAFAVLYRHEKIPLLRHLGELLTVTVLGGACFGLPTTIVSERERGVGRRYRLTPLPAWRLAVSTLGARYLIILSAGLLQLAIALAVGLTPPAHPFMLWVAFSLVAFAFMGLGWVIAMLADNVPAVQALGQCLFLPMLIIGGVAVPLASLPPWAQHLSAFFPGRYAVEALQACVDGPGLGGARFSLLALFLIGAAGLVAGTKLFRWDAQQRFSLRQGKAGIFCALVAWLAVGLLAEVRGRIAVPANLLPPPAEAPAPVPVVAVPHFPWQDIEEKDIAALDYHTPGDDDVVTPIAAAEDDPDESGKEQLNHLRSAFAHWAPGEVGDGVQQVRNYLCIAAVCDMMQAPIERHVPLVVLARLEQLRPRQELVQILTWIAQHPDEGTVVWDLHDLGLNDPGGSDDQIKREIQQRAAIYAVKFVARLTGRKTLQQ